MKRLIILTILAMGLSVGAQNTLRLSGGSGRPGDVVTVTMSLDNSDAVTAMQAFVPLGSQLQYVPNSAILTERSNSHALSATVLRDTLRIYSYSTQLNAYSGNSGALITFEVTLGQEPGDYTLRPSNSILSNSEGREISMTLEEGTVTIRAPKVEVTPSQIDIGHVPIRAIYRRTVNVRNVGNEPLTLESIELCPGYSLDQRTDVICPLMAMPTSATIAAGGQQEVEVIYSPTDAGAISMPVTFHTNAKVGDSVLTIAADPYSVNELRPLNVSGYTDGTVTLELRMNNMDEIAAMQTSIKLPAALTYVEGTFSADPSRAAGYLTTAGLRGDTLTLIMANLSGTPMEGNDGVIARLSLQLHGYGSHTLWLLGTVLSNTSGNNVLSAVYTGTVNIYSPTLSCENNVDLGSSAVTSTVNGELPLRNSGNAPLMIGHVGFMHDGWQLNSTLPMTVEAGGRDTLRFSYSGGTEGSHTTEMLVYSNDPRNDLKRINLTLQRYEPNRLYMESSDDATVSVMINNYSAITALQMDVKYPHRHFTLEPGDVSLGGRASGHTLNAVRQNDSTIRVLVFSMSNNSISGNSGEVVRLQFHAVNVADAASYTVTLDNVIVGCTDAQDRLSNMETTVQVRFLAPDIDDDNTCEVPCGVEKTIVCLVDTVRRTATVTGYTECEGDLVIPETFVVGGHTYTVTAIAPRAFFGCVGLTAVHIPITVVSYGEKAFAECPNLGTMSYKVRAAR